MSHTKRVAKKGGMETATKPVEIKCDMKMSKRDGGSEEVRKKKKIAT